MIRKSADALIRTINNILDFTKMESGKLELDEFPFDCTALVTEVYELFTPEASKRDLNLTYTIAPDVPNCLYGDMFRLRQILVNLVGNAVKFTDIGEVEIRISLLPERQGDEDRERVKVQFEVKDSGVGIPENKMDGLFQPFSQLDSSMNRKYGGSGLGLAICKSLVHMMQEISAPFR